MAFNQLTALDFNDIKASIRDYLKSSDIFTDYNFEGSALSNLVDILAYNTYYTAFNSNLIVNEAYLDSAILRENVVRLAKLLNYTPKSATASQAIVNISVQLPISNNYPDTLTLKAGIVFNSYNENGNFNFSIPNDVVVSVNKSTGSAVFSNLVIYEGNLVSTRYTVDTSSLQKYIIPNSNVDTNTLFVKIFPNPQSNTADLYLKVDNFLNLTKDSKVYFLQEIEDQKYELIFGDNVFGKQLTNNNVIQMQFIVCNGALGNNCSNFSGSFIGKIVDNLNNNIISGISITNIQPSLGGGDIESIDSIKFYAPRYFQAQSRAVTTKDYEALIPLIYANVDSVAIYGGEDDLPPQFGVVNLVIKPKVGLKLSDAEKLKLKKILSDYSVGSIVPQIKDPSIIYIGVDSTVYYNGLLTTKTPDQLKNDVISTIVNLNTSKDFNKFGGKFKYSKLLSLIDNTNNSITSNITKIKLKKLLLVNPNITTSYRTCFSNAIANFTGANSISSSGFKLLNQDQTKIFYFEDDTKGKIKIFWYDQQNVKNYLPNNNVKGNYGSVNYSTGEVIIDPIVITSVINTNSTVSLYVIPDSNDVVSLRDTYLTIDTDGLNISIIEDLISEGRTSSGISVIPASNY
jgi:hypothetical protein